MKKALKYGLLCITILAALFLLAGCGGSKVIATKSDDSLGIGKCDMKIEMDFKGDEITNIKTSITVEDETIAKLFVEESDGEIEFERDGNTISFELSAKEYEEAYGTSYTGMTKDEIIEQFETEGFTIEK